jgi:hypothetical protein
VKKKIVKYSAQSSEPFLLNRMQKEKANGFYKKGTFTNELVWGNYSFIISNQPKKKQESFRKGMFLYGMVRRDAKAFLKQYDFELPKQHSQIDYVKKFDPNKFRKITATDLNHAYWRIAYNLDIISHETYEKGLPDEFKAVRLATLSTLGAPKKYFKIVDGVLSKEFILQGGDPPLQEVYKLIRYECYKYMAQVKKLLGSDFICYKTDCIYYKDTIANKNKVHKFFEQKDLLIKQLV